MSEFGPEASAVDWLLDHFEEHPELAHLRARRRGRVVTIESGPPGEVVPHARFRRDTVHLWLLEMPSHSGRWDRTPYRDPIEKLMALLEHDFAWMLEPIAVEEPGAEND